jgi:1-phosphatidylinositol phosphodiesterase
MQLRGTYSNNWMSGIVDDTPVNAISIPGAHDSCARIAGVAGSDSAQCQWFGITQLLNRGIRFLDIRCRYITDGEGGRIENIYFPIHHGSIYQQILFEEVQAQCVAFLTLNPSECILMNVQMEYDECLKNKNSCSDNFQAKFLELTSPYLKHWYMKNVNPNLKDVRGRIVLIRSYNPKNEKGWSSSYGLEWNGFDFDELSENAHFETQNCYGKGWSMGSKETNIKQYLASAKDAANKGKFTLNFVSCTSPSKSPGELAEELNPYVKQYIKTNSVKPLGVVLVDFVGNTGDGGGDSLENLIIESQLPEYLVPDTSYMGIPEWLKLVSA